MATKRRRSSSTYLLGLLVPALAFFFTNVPHAKAENVKASIETLVSEQARINRYVELDLARQDLMFHQASTILAIHGGYNSYDKSGEAQSNGTDLSRFINRVSDYSPKAVGDFQRKTARDASLPPEETSMSNRAMEVMEEMLEAAREIIDLCDANKPLEASLV